MFGVWVFGKALVHEFPISYSHAEWYLLTIVVFWLGCDRASGVFGRALVHEFPISYSHAEWYLLLSLYESNE